MQKTRVMLVEDDAYCRRLFELYIRGFDAYELAFSVKTAATADIYLVNNKIDLILMDIFMRDGSCGLAAARRIKKSCPQVKIVMITGMGDGDLPAAAYEAGADGFWHKDADAAALLSVMDRVMADERVFCDSFESAS